MPSSVLDDPLPGPALRRSEFSQGCARPRMRHGALAWSTALMLAAVAVLSMPAIPDISAAEASRTGLNSQAPVRTGSSSELYEAVLVIDGEQVQLFLDRFDTNEPVANAQVELIAGNSSLAGAPQPDGTYQFRIPGLREPGRHQLVLSIVHPHGNDLLTAEVNGQTAGSGLPEVQRRSLWSSLSSPFGILVTLLAGATIGLVAGRRRRTG